MEGTPSGIQFQEVAAPRAAERTIHFKDGSAAVATEKPFAYNASVLSISTGTRSERSRIYVSAPEHVHASASIPSLAERQAAGSEDLLVSPVDPDLAERFEEWYGQPVPERRIFILPQVTENAALEGQDSPLRVFTTEGADVLFATQREDGSVQVCYRNVDKNGISHTTSVDISADEIRAIQQNARNAMRRSNSTPGARVLSASPLSEGSDYTPQLDYDALFQHMLAFSERRWSGDDHSEDTSEDQENQNTSSTEIPRSGEEHSGNFGVTGEGEADDETIDRIRAALREEGSGESSDDESTTENIDTYRPRKIEEAARQRHEASRRPELTRRQQFVNKVRTGFVSATVVGTTLATLAVPALGRLGINLTGFGAGAQANRPGISETFRGASGHFGNNVIDMGAAAGRKEYPGGGTYEYRTTLGEYSTPLNKLNAEALQADKNLTYDQLIKFDQIVERVLAYKNNTEGINLNALGPDTTFISLTPLELQNAIALAQGKSNNPEVTKIVQGMEVGTNNNPNDISTVSSYLTDTYSNGS